MENLLSSSAAKQAKKAKAQQKKVTTQTTGLKVNSIEIVMIRILIGVVF